MIAPLSGSFALHGVFLLFRSFALCIYFPFEKGFFLFSLPLTGYIASLKYLPVMSLFFFTAFLEFALYGSDFDVS